MVSGGIRRGGGLKIGEDGEGKSNSIFCYFPS